MFRNHQWVVNATGMDTTGKPAPYVIDASRLLESSDRGVDERFYDWPLQVAEKTWVDVEAFIEAFEEALVVHADKLPGPIDKDMLFRSFNEAHRLARMR